MLGLHKASFAVWVAAMSVHVLGHIPRVRRLAAGELRGNARGAPLRAGIVAAVVVSGAILAVATLPLVHPWVHWLHFAGAD